MLLRRIMARNLKRKALYEVINKAQAKPRNSPAVPRQQMQKDNRPTPDSPGRPLDRSLRWSHKARYLQFNVGRIEFSMPYQLAIVFMLGLILVVMLAFRLGQTWHESVQPAQSGSENTQAHARLAEPAAQAIKRNLNNSRSAAESTEDTLRERSAANNRIVIQTWGVRAQLEPVKAYFARCGIETEIRKIGDRYFLVTKQKYENPQRSGTDGYRAKQRIIKLGTDYEAPPGYGSFGPEPFHDAYGMKFDD